MERRIDNNNFVTGIVTIVEETADSGTVFRSSVPLLLEELPDNGIGRGHGSWHRRRENENWKLENSLRAKGLIGGER